MRANDLDECLLEIALPGLALQSFQRALKFHAAIADYDDVIAEVSDFLHHVAGEQHAAAFVLQPQNDFAQSTGCHDIQAVRWFIEQDVSRVMHHRAGEGDFDPLSLRET